MGRHNQNPFTHAYHFPPDDKVSKRTALSSEVKVGHMEDDALVSEAHFTPNDVEPIGEERITRRDLLRVFFSKPLLIDPNKKLVPIPFESDL